MALRAQLPVFAKRMIWEFKYGVKKYSVGRAPKDAVTRLAALPHDAEVLEFGCGRGSLISALRAAGWQGSYCGVDISATAIRDANRVKHDARTTWMVSDIESFRSDKTWDAIALIESIYYVDIGKVPEVLQRSREMLKADGLLLLRIHDFSKHRTYVETIYAAYPHTQRSDFLLLIHSQPESARAASAS